MKNHFYFEKRIVIKDCIYPEYNGKTCIITDYFKTGNILALISDIKTSFNDSLIIYEHNIDYIKQFDSYMYVYMNIKTLENTYKPYIEKTPDSIEIGCFDIYEKLYPPFNF